MILSVNEAKAYANGDEGYCTNCDEFTNGDVEPDAVEYECISCGEETVMGAELAITVHELIKIIGE